MQLHYFNYKHLPPHLQGVSQLFHSLAHSLQALPVKDGAQIEIAFQKLLEAKDAAVRSMLSPPPNPEERL